MMQKAIFAAAPLLLVTALAACGGGAENKAKGKADALQPGQYEVVAETTNFRAADKGAPKFESKAGDRVTRSVCVADSAALPPALFADDGFDCTAAGSIYARGGSLNATLQCAVAGREGSAGYNVNGTFEGDSFDAERTLTTLLISDGDVVITSRLRGRRTGDCSTAPPTPTNAAAGTNKAG